MVNQPRTRSQPNRVVLIQNLNPEPDTRANQTRIEQRRDHSRTLSNPRQSGGQTLRHRNSPKSSKNRSGEVGEGWARALHVTQTRDVRTHDCIDCASLAENIKRRYSRNMILPPLAIAQICPKSQIPTPQAQHIHMMYGTCGPTPQDRLDLLHEDRCKRRASARNVASSLFLGARLRSTPPLSRPTSP